MCADTALVQPKEPGKTLKPMVWSLDAGQYLFIQFLAVCSLRVKYMSIALTEYLVVIKRLGSLGSQLVSTKLG